MFKSKKKTIEKKKIFGLNLISNCNNEATDLEVSKEKMLGWRRKKRFKEYYFRESRPIKVIKDTKIEKYNPYKEYKIPSPPIPKCKRFQKCKKIVCSPLSSIGIQLQEDIPIKLGEGSFNLAYTIKNHFSDDSKDLVFRITRPGLESKIPGQILREQIGLEYQTLLSKKRSENGLECPYISKVYDFGIFEVNHYSIVNNILKPKKNYATSEIGIYSIMEKVNGGELKKRILKHNYTLEESRRLMVNLLNCLKCIHKKKIVHLDLKLENILLVQDESSDNINKNTDIKLIDFGLSGEIDESIGIRGTPAYLPLKMIKDSLENKRHKITVADDIWSAGIILLEILTKKTSNKNYDRIHKINANMFYGLKPNKTTYDIIKKNFFNDSQGEEWIKLQNFFEKIFGKEGIKYRMGTDGKTLIPTTEQPIITVEELLEDEWLKPPLIQKESSLIHTENNSVLGRLGGKRKYLKKKKTKKKHKKIRNKITKNK